MSTLNHERVRRHRAKRGFIRVEVEVPDAADAQAIKDYAQRRRQQPKPATLGAELPPIDAPAPPAPGISRAPPAGDRPPDAGGALHQAAARPSLETSGGEAARRAAKRRRENRAVQFHTTTLRLDREITAQISAWLAGRPGETFTGMVLHALRQTHGLEIGPGQFPAKAYRVRRFKG